MFDFELKAGLIFGLETDTIYVVEEEQEEDPKPSTIITLYLGFVALHFIF